MSNEKPIRSKDGHLVYKQNKEAVQNRKKGEVQIQMSQDVAMLQRQIRRAFAYINNLEKRIIDLEKGGK